MNTLITQIASVDMYVLSSASSARSTVFGQTLLLGMFLNEKSWSSAIGADQRKWRSGLWRRFHHVPQVLKKVPLRSDFNYS